jgi:hypothetical protein
MYHISKEIEKICKEYDIEFYPTLSKDFIREFKDKVDWYYISRYQELSEDFVRKFKDEVDWVYISIHQKLSENFIREFRDKVNWTNISEHQKLSEDFIQEFKDRVDWYYISGYQKLSEDFIREFKDRINWNHIFIYQKLSEDFIREFRDKVNLDLICKHQKLSKYLKEELKSNPQTKVQHRGKVQYIESNQNKDCNNTAIAGKDKGKGMFNSIQKYYKDHEEVLFPLIIVVVLDHFFNDGALRSKIAQLVQGLLDGIQKKLLPGHTKPEE